MLNINRWRYVQNKEKYTDDNDKQNMRKRRNKKPSAHEGDTENLGRGKRIKKPKAIHTNTYLML